MGRFSTVLRTALICPEATPHGLTLTTGFSPRAFTVIVEGISRVDGGTGRMVTFTLAAASTLYENVFCVRKFTWEPKAKIAAFLSPSVSDSSARRS